MDVEQFRKAGYAAIDQICDYYSSIEQRDVKSLVKPGYLLDQLSTTPPTKGEDFPAIAADFQRLVMPGITHWQHPKFFAYFPSTVTFESILGDMYSSAVSNPGFNWACSPACTELEQVVMEWMVTVLGLDDVFRTSSGKGGGIIGTSASDMCLTAAIAARERALRVLARDHHQVNGTATPTEGPTDVPYSVRSENTKRLVMYGSTQTHSIGVKTALLLGLTFRTLPVKSADGYALRGDLLKAAIEEDIKKGFVPFFVIGTVGTTSSGAVDYIGDIGEVVHQYPTMFLHIDAAWAGMAWALPEQREALRLAEVNKYGDSVCTNAHKWGLVGFDCSLFFVRDRRDLTEALDVTPTYLRTKEADAGAVIDYRNWQLALGRRFRSVKLWFVMRGYGVEGLQAHLRNGISLCSDLVSEVAKDAKFEIVAPPRLGLLCFRLLKDGASASELDKLNVELHTRLAERPDVHLTQTILKSEDRGEIFCIRFAIGALRTTKQDVEEVWDEVVKESDRLVLEGNQVTN
ncbi:hypothetical protein CspeluHIS016_0803390 [Cutaneotrichosporon spelunceum]|uniref:Aromatic-L-amino-acid decarboxylase n=1 Tax=Cutaneotrichosporon spelunceum TaxID=1672016 RepID=A0AAD3TZP5_9TREE|nr:hypothetical protein CspeluHIS016_0803390 [Cutaneotrichosporon spelunceum]